MKFQPVQWHDTLDSTQSELRRLILPEPLLPNGTVIAARYQTQGRGRKGRTWITAAGGDLTCSFLIRTDAQRKDLHSLTLTAAIAVADSLKKLNLHPQLKWPNDILVNQKKIAGILAEHINLPHAKDTAVIIGLGLNVNMTKDQANKIDQPATSILIETNKTNTVDTILTLILKDLAATIQTWQQKGFAPLRDRWLQRCDHLGRNVTVTNANTNPQHGTFAGLADDGQLLLSQPNGQIQKITTGDLSLI